MHLPRKWINSDLISSRILLLLPSFSSLNTSNPKPYTVVDHNQKAAIRRDDRVTVNRHLALFMFVVVFMIVAVAVGTKRLAFGITVSAFVLLVLEYVGSLSYSTSNRIQFFVRSCFPLLATGLRFEQRNEKHRTQVYVNVASSNLCETSENASSGRIDDYVVGEQNVMDEKKMSGGEEEFIDAGTIEITGTEKRRSRRAILKAKIISRLSPKNFRRSKCRKGSEGKFEDHSVKVDSSGGSLTIRQVISEVDSDSEECKYFHFPVGPAKVGDDREQSGDLSWQSDHSLGDDSFNFGSSQANEVLKRQANIQIDARGKSGYVMLVVIVLAGLVGGKILSFLLAIGYCCIMKCIGTAKGSAQPIHTSSVQYTI